MRRLFPTPAAEVDPRDAYAVPAAPYLRVNMVASVDGAAAVAGRVGALSGPADDAVLHVLRGLADVILVGRRQHSRRGLRTEPAAAGRAAPA